MRYLKEYYNYDNQVAEICKKFGIKNWSIRDGLVDVDGDVRLWNSGLIKLPLKFGRISGYFYCEDNNLTTLEGSPKEVGGYFNCSDNNLTTLESGPKEVGGYFSCNDNSLTTLEGGPKEVGGYFYCSNNELTTLEYMPNVKGDIYISGNPLPKEIYDNISLIKYIVEHQEEYDIWFNGKLDLPRFNLMISDIKEFDLKK
jgi:hypothetical protein